MARFCHSCGAQLGDPQGGFCPKCGAPATTQPATGVTPAGAPDWGAVGSLRRWLRRPIVLGVAALAAGGLAAVVVVAMVLGNAPEDRTVNLVPADAAFYATLFLDPSLGQKRAAGNLLERAGKAGGADGDTEPLERGIETLIESSTSLDYERDVEPYLGDQIGIYARAGGDSALVVALEDPRAAAGALRRGGYSDIRESSEGSEVFAVVGNLAAIGSSEEVRASVQAASAGSLAGVAAFEQARDRASDDVLAFGYLDGEPLLREAQGDENATSEELLSLEALSEAGPVAATLTAHSERLDLELSGRSGDAAPPQDPSELLRTLPADASAAISVGDLEGLLAQRSGIGGDLVEQLREPVSDLAELDVESDVASWVGAVAAYVVGEDPDAVEGAIVAETRSPRESDRVVDRIENYYAGYDYGSSVYPSEDGLGFDVSADEDIFQVRTDEDRVVAGGGQTGLSTERALDAEGNFGESELYERAAALLGGFEPFLAVDAPRIQRLVEEATDAEYDTTYMTEVRDWLSGTETLAGGVRRNGEDLRIRLSVGVTDPTSAD